MVLAPVSKRRPSPLDGRLSPSTSKTCDCAASHTNCLTAKEWMKSQIGVWQFTYEKRDVRDKAVHPATFPISMAKKVIQLFTHEGELVVDPFVGSGTTLVAAHDLARNAIGFDLSEEYVSLSNGRIGLLASPNGAEQKAYVSDARLAAGRLPDETVQLLFTSPPYANLLNRARKNKSRRGDLRKNDQYMKTEQYSQDERDLGILSLSDYQEATRDIYARLLTKLKPGGACVINIPDMWWEDQRVTIHTAVIDALRMAGYEFRNTVIWDRTNIVNRIGIFGWPNNYITMGTTFEYILHFRRPKG